MRQHQKRHYALLLVLAIVLISMVHYILPESYNTIHHSLQYSHYILILMGALYFERWPGVLFVLLIVLLHLPHLLGVQNTNENTLSLLLVEFAFILGVSLLVGTVVRHKRLKQERLQREVQQLARLEKMALLGKLSAGLAHEIRNPLGSLVGSAQIVHQSLGAAHPQSAYMDTILSEMKRLDTLLGNFLQFARPRDPSYVKNSLTDLVDSTAEVVRQRCLCSIRIAHQEGIPLLAMDYEQLKQVLINLLNNAIALSKEHDEILITTFYRDHSFGFSVQDQAGGVPPEYREQIFEPFFSKTEGGTGLGLAICREIIQSMNGSIRLHSDQRGSTFTVSVPDEK